MQLGFPSVFLVLAWAASLIIRIFIDLTWSLFKAVGDGMSLHAGPPDVLSPSAASLQLISVLLLLFSPSHVISMFPQA
jgi:hypothetical protein